MGTFAALFESDHKNIPGDKEILNNRRQEFSDRVEKVFQCGGMMEMEYLNLWGDAVATIRKAQIDPQGMDFYYNYFEDGCGMDFRELGTEVKDVVYRKQNDMIPYWEDDGKIVFSEDLWQWFGSLKTEFDSMMDDKVILERPLRYIFNLMKEAEENYHNIFAFTDFVEESLENLNNKKYQVLWRIYDNLIHDPELKKAGDVIFVPDGPGHEKEGLHYSEKTPKRRLICNWSLMPVDKKFNKGRVILRRYMALVANRLLREKIFGF